MREIKFRAWSKRLEKYVKPSEFLITGHGDIYNVCLGDEDETEDREPKQLILEQYVGLKDKNGREIYEGDILQNKKYMSVVEFLRCAFLAKVYFGGKPTKQHFNLRGEIITSEVVGNIHQNVDLLEES
jgi:uncharacterized phage protein (TIGR01671 family)